MKCNRILVTVTAGALLGCTQVPVARAPADPGGVLTHGRSGLDRTKTAASRTSSGRVTDLAALYRQGREAQEAGQAQQAEAAYAKVLAADPQHADTLNALGVLRARAGRLQEALALFDRAVAAEPGNASVRNNRGYALLLAERLDEAGVELQAALTLNPASNATRANLDQLARVQAVAVARSTGLEPAAVTRLVAVAPNIYELHDAGTSDIPARRMAAEANLAPAQQAPTPATLAGVRLEVSNGVGIRHMALRTSKRLERLGLVTARLTNQSGYQQSRTEIQYGAGYQQAALDLSARLALAPPAKQAKLDQKVQIRLIIGRDLVGQAIVAGEGAEPSHLVSQNTKIGWVLG